MKKRFKVLLLGLLVLGVFALIAPVVPGPASSPSCYQNGVAGYVTQSQFNKDGSTWLTVCDGQQNLPNDPAHCVTALVTSNVVDNPCVPIQPESPSLPASLKRANFLRARECGQ